MSDRTFSREWLTRRHVTAPFMSRVVVHSEKLHQDDDVSLHQVVIYDEGRYWSVVFQESELGLGHLDPWFDQDLVKAVEVYPVYRVVSDWKEVEDGAPAPLCRPLDVNGRNSLVCHEQAEWVMAYRYNGEARVTELCSEHLYTSLNRNGNALDIREVKHR
ncbi:hypothetical protein ACFW2V_12570 [Streptomyces sp. NPDC058947]|uniref:hypothetical protein n=1 Tax=Streptomyces sp. NPDC058947 TaxID=3346675 RepID=UPI0036AD28FA